MHHRIGIALSALLICSGCNISIDGVGSTITGSGTTKEERRGVGAFTKVDVSAAFEATVDLGPECSVTLDVDDNLLPLVETRVVDGRLEVGYVEGSVVVAKKPQRVSIVVASLDLIAARGAAKVVANAIAGKAIKVESAGASSVELKGLGLESVDVKSDGAGRVTLEGKGKALTLDASGASKFRAAEATFESADVTIAGASHCEVNVTGAIVGEVSGASSLNVSGNPASRTVKATGAAHLTY